MYAPALTCRQRLRQNKTEIVCAELKKPPARQCDKLYIIVLSRCYPQCRNLSGQNHSLVVVVCSVKLQLKADRVVL